MTISFGFYNSVLGDRVYDAIDIAKMFDGLLNDGVFEVIGTALGTTAGTGMQVIVGVGKAWFNHTYTINDAALPLVIQPSDLVNPRIDTVVLEVDASSGNRANTIKVLTGTPAAIPAAPALTNTTDVHQYPLANIAVGAGVTSIITANISNLVGTVYCPYVTIPQAGVGNVAGVLQMQIFS